MGLLDSYGWAPVRIPGGPARPACVPLRGSTNGSGDVTLTDDYAGNLPTPSRASNAYTITVGPYQRLLACLARTSNGIVSSVVPDPANGTVVVTFSALQASVPFDVCIYVDRGMQ